VHVIEILIWQEAIGLVDAERDPLQPAEVLETFDAGG